MKRLISLIFMLIAMAIAVNAQNSIDRAIDNFSTVGNSTFTSAEERDSNTRKIKKVVKRLTMEGEGCKKLRETFEAEKKSGDYSSKQEDGITTLMLTTRDSKANRIYMLRIKDADRYPKAELTVIESMK